MTTRNRIKTVLLLAAVAIAILILPTAAQVVPSQLPDPDGKPGDATKPVKVYILAGQSNMVGFGALGGARCPYAAIYLTADPDAKMGPFQIYRGGNYKIAPLGIYVSADKNAVKGAIASIGGNTDNVALGVSTGSLPVKSGQTCVVRAFIEVPESGNYLCGPGYQDSSYNVMELDGKEVYRRNIGEAPVRQKVTLEKGKRYPIKVTYFKGGSAAFWLSQVDLLGKGDLEIVTKRDKKFPWMIDDQGNWTVRNDVYYQEVRIAADGRGCLLSATSNGKFIGPEVPFGYVMGTFHDEQVLLIESSMGNRGLWWDFRPPSSGKTAAEGADKWEGLEYRLMVEGVHKTLKNIKIVPGYKGQGYEIAGFVWWQGHKDGGAGQTQAQYEKHLVNLIKDLRAEFNVPGMPAVVATVGFGGYNLSEKDTEIWKAQMAVADPRQHPEFAGQVKTVDTRGFWRQSDESPTGTGYHYNHNAETYMLTGDALGRAMVELQGGKAEPLPYGNRPKSTAKVKAPVTEELDEAAKAAAAKASQKALEPIIVDGMMQGFIADPRNQAALAAIISGEKPKRTSQFLRDTMYGLNNFYNAAGVDDYNWKPYGPDLANVKWDYFSFDPPETKDKSKGGRFRKVTYPEGMENWFAPDFDAKKAGWKKGLPPFGQKGGELVALGNCKRNICRCGETPRTLWEKEVIMIRGTFEIPPLKEGYRYRIVVGGSAHVNAGEGYAIYVNGKLLAESNAGVGKRQGGQPRGGHIYKEYRDEFKDGKVTIAAMSFLRYNHPRIKPFPPSGHLTVWMEEQKLPSVSHITE